MSRDVRIVIGGSSGVSFITLLGLLFIGLKLAHVIEWSWFWVTVPFWATGAVFACVFVFIAVVAFVLFVINKLS